MAMRLQAFGKPSQTNRGGDRNPSPKKDFASGGRMIARGGAGRPPPMIFGLFAAR
jgi:hypothetical protein